MDEKIYPWDEKTYPCKGPLCDKRCDYEKCPRNAHGKCIDHEKDIRFCMTEFGHDERNWTIVSAFLLCVLAKGFGDFTEEELHELYGLIFDQVYQKLDAEKKMNELMDKIKARKEREGEENGTQST